MTKIQLITIEDCPGIECRQCRLADAVLHRVAGLAGIDLPPHEEGSRGEHYLAEGLTVEAVHLGCNSEEARAYDPENAPYLIIDGKVVLQDSDSAFKLEAMAQAVLDTLHLANLRP